MFSIDKNYLKEQDELIEQLEKEIVELNKKFSEGIVKEEKVVPEEDNTIISSDEISNLKESIIEEKEKNDELNKKIARLETEIFEFQENVGKKTDVNEKLDIQIEEQLEKISALEQEKYDLQNRLSLIEEQVGKRDNEISSLMEKIKYNEEIIANLKTKDEKIKEFEDRISSVEKETNEKYEIMQEMEKTMFKLKKQVDIVNKGEKLDELTIVQYEEIIMQLEKTVENLKNQLYEKYPEEEDKRKVETEEIEKKELDYTINEGDLLLNSLKQSHEDIDELFKGEVISKTYNVTIGFITIANYYEIQSEYGTQISLEILSFLNSKLTKYLPNINSYPLTVFSNNALFINFHQDKNDNIESSSALVMTLKGEMKEIEDKLGLETGTIKLFASLHYGNIDISVTGDEAKKILISGKNLVIPGAVLKIMKNMNFNLGITFAPEEVASDIIDTDFVTDIKLKDSNERIKLFEIKSVNKNFTEIINASNKDNEEIDDINMDSDDNLIVNDENI